MAAFNESQNQPVVSTGLSGASRGQQSNDAMGELFKGLGQTLNNTLTAYDTATRTKIELQADEAVNGAATEASPGPDGRLPPSAQASLGNIASYKAALDQGTISQVMFDTRVAQEAKRLRGTVPAGYGPIVEKALASAVGSSTANQLRSSQMRAIDEANAAVDTGHKAKRTWLDQETNNKYFYMPDVQAFVEHATGRKIQDIVNNPDDASFAMLQEGVSRQRAIESQYDYEMKTVQRNEQISKYQGSMAVDRVLANGFNRDISVPYGKYLDAVDKAGAEWDKTDIENIGVAYSQFKIGITADLEREMAEKKIPGEARGEMRERLKSDLATIEYYIADGNVGMINQIKNRFARGKDEVSEKLWSSSNYARQIAAMRDNGFSDSMIQTIAQSQTDGSYSAISSAVVSSVAGVLTGKANPEDVFGAMEQYIPKDQQAKFNKEWVDKLGQVLNMPNEDPKAIASAAKNLFDEQNDALLASLPWENRLNIFQKLMSPSVVKKIIESGDVDAMNAASRWGETQMRVISRRAQDSMVDGQKFRYKINITFDGEKFIAAPRTPTGKEFAYNASLTLVDDAARDNAEAAVQEMNRYIGIMKPLWDAQKKDTATAMGFIMQENINKIQHEAPILQSMVEGIYSYLQGDKKSDKSLSDLIVSPAGAAVPGKDEKPGLPPSGTGAPITYNNKGATRNRKVTPELEGKLSKAVKDVFGDGYTVQIFSGGQPAKGEKGARTGTIRHDDHGHGGQAADVYIIGPDGKKVTDTRVLDKLKNYWLKNDMGSVGTYMRGAGMHLDEWTKEELLAGMGQTWTY